MEFESQTIHSFTVFGIWIQAYPRIVRKRQSATTRNWLSGVRFEGHSSPTRDALDDAMTQQRLLSISCFAILVLAIAAPAARAEPKPAKGVKQKTAAPGLARRCRSDEEAFRILKLTTVEGGTRVDYEFVRSGEATWTNMNRPLLRQFGVRVGATICLPRDPQSTDTTDFE
jgi:hypothetical protein